MSGFANPFAPKSRGIPGRTADIKAWIRTAFSLSDDIVIVVSEIACREEDCPDIETVIGIMRPGEAIEALRIHKPVSEIAHDDIVALTMDAGNSAD